MTAMTMPSQDPHPVVKLSPHEQECLRIIVGHMIPASERYGLPGVDAPHIFSELLGDIRRDGPALKRLLGEVEAAAGGCLGDLLRADQCAVLAKLRAERPGMFGVAEALASRAYYQNDAVLASIGMEPRSPFPKGYELPQGDLSLLDEVRKRGRIYRDVNDASPGHCNIGTKGLSE